MKTFKQFIEEQQEHKSAETSLSQVSGGLKYAVKNKLIKPNSVNIDHGGGKYDKGKEHVESSVSGAKLHVHDPYNRSIEHNEEILKKHSGNADYVGLHNVLNVIKEPEHRKEALHKVKSFMKPSGTAHITVYEGDKTGNSRMSRPDKGKGSSWQEHRSTESYMDEVKSVFPEHSHEVTRKGSNIVVKGK